MDADIEKLLKFPLRVTITTTVRLDAGHSTWYPGRMAYRRSTIPRRMAALLVLLSIPAALVPLAVSSAAAAVTVVSRGSTQTAWASESTTALRVVPPSTARAGDLLLATLGVGKTGASSQPVLTAPSGWVLVSRTNQDKVATLAVYRHVFVAGETSYTFTSNTPVGGTGFVAAFGDVDASRPIDAYAGRTVGKGTSVATPSVTTTSPGDMVVASFFGYRGAGGAVTWSAPSGLTELGDVGNGSRSGSIDAGVQVPAGSTGAKTATVSARIDYGIGVVVTLRPATATTTQPPVISGLAAGGVTSSSAAVAWTTDQAADSKVEYGTTTGYGSTTPVDATPVTSHAVTISGLAPDTTYHVRVVSANAAGQSTASADLTFRTAAAPPSGGRTPLIVDTDMFSSADDVGALAVAFGLQLRGEADVIGIAVDTRTSRPAVATNSWRCAAAIAQFYGDPTVPIGTHMPNNGTEVNTIDWIRPCAQRAASSTPTPIDALSMYRRALVAQPDSSVVIASVGYTQNLRDLLDSPADAISPLTGRDLIARKVRSLVIMGGGFPSWGGENNLAGDPVAAQRVASGWPGRIVWSGYEVGDAVQTGSTISTVHPANSPVRIAYEAYVGPRKWIDSYDLTAVYHAVRPTESVYGFVGPGTNVVTSTGANTFAAGAGNQYYLTLPNDLTAEAKIEELLDVLPGATSSGPVDSFSSTTIDPSQWNVGGSGSTVAAANGQLEITHAAGAWTNGSVVTTATHDQTGRSVQLRVRRAANNGLGGASFGETSIRLQVDTAHYAELFVASGAISAWVNQGSGATNLTPNWPGYSSTTMQWLRFRESGGRLYLEYASGSSAPGTWQTLASVANPFPLTAVRLAIIAGANTTTSDVAQFDDVSTY